MEIRSLAKCSRFDITDEHYGPMLTGYFTYEDGGSQGIGFIVDMEFIIGLLRVIGVTSLRAIEGRSCWITHDNSNISLIEPLHKTDGKSFDINKWSEEAKARCKALTAAGLR